MIRKRLLSACLALALCLSLLPVTALAAAAPSRQVIYVGNTNVTSGGYWTTGSDGTVTSAGNTQPGDNYIHYNANDNILTLHNATIKESVSTNTSTFIAGAAIGVFNKSGNAELTITLEGTNTIAEVGKGIYVLANSTGAATLNITGDGSLDASASQTGIWVQSNNGNGALFIQNAKVEATGTSYGVNVQSHKSSTASLTVDGGSLTASGSPGILYDSSGSGTVPSTTALTIINSAIVDAREGGIGAGLLQDLKEVSPADDSVGIVFDGDDGTVYGNATLQENLTIGEDESLTIPDGASLDTNGKLTVDGGTLTQNGTVTGDIIYKVTGVSLNKSETTLTVGGTETLTATVLPEGATNKSVTWSSNAPSVATVDENGVVTAVGSGTATITVKTEDGNYTADCTVSVTPYIPPVPSYLIQLPEVEGGTVTADRATARQGTEVALTVTPDEGFALASLAVTDFFGSTVEVTRNADGTYSFVMPYSQVEVAAAFTPLALPFADVDEGDWFYDEVAYVWANGLMDGVDDDRFHPEGTASRAMVWAILARMDGETVTGEGWAEAARAWAMETGVSDGEDGGAPVTREQLAAMLYRYAARKGWDVTERADLSAFADGDDVSPWALDALAWASAAGIVEGTAPATLEPQGEAVRAQLAAMLARFCQTAAAP